MLHILLLTAPERMCDRAIGAFSIDQDGTDGLDAAAPMKTPDPVYASSRREMWIIFAIWGIFCVWVVGYCKFNAFAESVGEVALLFGMPSWVFWGVAVPWIVATTFSIVFALFFMTDHDLEGAGEDTP